MRVPFLCTLLVLSVGFAVGQDTNFATGPQYLRNSSSPFLARSISTPSLSLSGPTLETGASNATGILAAGADDRTISVPEAVAVPAIDLFPIFYGDHTSQAIESSSAQSSSVQPSSEIPASIRESEVTQINTPQSLQQRGYEVTLAAAAARSKAAAGRPSRVYTNADIERLRGGS